MGQVQSRQDESYFKLESSDKAALEKKYIGESKHTISNFIFFRILVFATMATSCPRWRPHTYKYLKSWSWINGKEAEESKQRKTTRGIPIFFVAVCYSMRGAREMAQQPLGLLDATWRVMT